VAIEQSDGSDRSSVNPEPFYRRCDELSEEWERLRKESHGDGNTANGADMFVRVAGLALAAGATVVTTLVAADSDGSLSSSTIGAILAALATVFTGLQATGTLRTRGIHHYERMDIYRTAAEKARNLSGAVESGAVALDDAWRRLDDLVDFAGRRPPS
jgi:hypothetical protein